MGLLMSLAVYSQQTVLNSVGDTNISISKNQAKFLIKNYHQNVAKDTIIGDLKAVIDSSAKTITSQGIQLKLDSLIITKKDSIIGIKDGQLKTCEDESEQKDKDIKNAKIVGWLKTAGVAIVSVAVTVLILRYGR